MSVSLSAAQSQPVRVSRYGITLATDTAPRAGSSTRPSEVSGSGSEERTVLGLRQLLLGLCTPQQPVRATRSRRTLAARASSSGPRALTELGRAARSASPRLTTRMFQPYAPLAELSARTGQRPCFVGRPIWLDPSRRHLLGHDPEILHDHVTGAPHQDQAVLMQAPLSADAAGLVVLARSVRANPALRRPGWGWDPSMTFLAARCGSVGTWPAPGPPVRERQAARVETTGSTASTRSARLGASPCPEACLAELFRSGRRLVP